MGLYTASKHIVLYKTTSSFLLGDQYIKAMQLVVQLFQSDSNTWAENKIRIRIGTILCNIAVMYAELISADVGIDLMVRYCNQMSLYSWA